MKFTIFKRLTFGYIAIMLLVIFLGIYVTFKLNQLNLLTRSIASVDGSIINRIEHMLDTMYSQVSFGKKYLISKDKDFYKQFVEMEGYFKADMEALEPFLSGTDNESMYSETTKLYDRYISQFKNEHKFIETGQEYPADQYGTDKETIIDQMNQKLVKINKIARLATYNKIYEANKISSRVLKVVAITAVLTVIIGVLISFFNTKIINRSVLLLKDRTKEIAKGKFAKIEDITSPPEIKELADSFNLMCERLKEIDELKEDFVSHISHELRTPLTAIREATSMLLDGVFADEQEKRHELLTVLHEECERLIHLVNSILDLSCMEAKMVGYHMKECNIFPVIQKSVLHIAPIARRKHINLELKPPQEMPLVKIDQERIGQVMENLLGNALKFTNNGGTVIVVCGCREENGRDNIEISVSDNGCGILRENLENIFDKFVRIESGEKTIRGTGLGLSIAKHVVTAHGGMIWAQSKPGEGSTFSFTLPVSC
ncbi:MAG: HAMP domain-containing protein [Candidatus Scalindua sp. AMX11]|nr:MAG: HAMP domain-containing protein [Candidatus Scalindua sp.]NOG84510.1 sensor histidine kinase [Planctomycetota bacterium]RZV80482.1 MAG: HAMP domain-containing protein [Candidatus Scalindua sp. SCAELEC01]TDE65297.1 MAG: HAMP domain-containing protein [Candidatus Scalindua sp. AMX11]GJQ58510.1 MAG: two-component sensor histidine kinase [Candidatus Scalindua sp.]